MDSKKIYQQLVEAYNPFIGLQEAEGFALLVIENLWSIDRTDILLGKELVFGTVQHTRLGEILERVSKQEPIQYILGEAWFYGRKFGVNPSVLIPRPETEELVYWIRTNHRVPQLKLLDIGTGSGCIPITLALEMKLGEVMGLDISQEALAIAQKNAHDLRAPVEFLQTDILTEEIPLRNWDIIVSNPPYIRDLEKEQMQANVLDHEPHLALFVSNADPLLFYRTIGLKAKKSLKQGGWLYFEINEAFGQATMDLLAEQGYINISLQKDLQGKDRMLRAARP